MIQPDTFYSTLGAIPQTLGVLIAILVAFLHFRVNRLEGYLVGDGQAAYNRKNDFGYKLTDLEWKRLKDAIARMNIYEIKAILKILRDNAESQGHTREENPTGLIVAYEDRFCGTLELIRVLKKKSIFSIGIGTLTIIISLLSLAFADLIQKKELLFCILLFLNVVLTIITLVLSFFTIYQGLMKKPLHETDREDSMKKK